MLTNSEHNLLEALNDLRLCNFGTLLNFEYCGKTYSIDMSKYTGDYDDAYLEQYRKHLFKYRKEGQKVYVHLHINSYTILSRIFYLTDITSQFDWIKNVLIDIDINLAEKNSKIAKGSEIDD